MKHILTLLSALLLSALLLSALLLSALLLTSFAASFVPSAMAAEPTSAETQQPAAAPQSDMVIVSGGVANYTVVRAEDASLTAVTGASQLAKRIANYTGITPTQATDWRKAGTQTDPNKLEILVGKTAHPESAEGLKDLAYGSYSIKQIGRKLVISAWSDVGLEKALATLYSTIRKTATQGNLTLPGDLNLTGTAGDIANNLPLYIDGDTVLVVDTGSQAYTVVVENTNAAAYTAYTELLVEKGFSLHTRREINGNRFATYTDGTYAIHANYIGYAGEVRLVIEKAGVLPAAEPVKAEKAVVTPRFAMLGLEFDYNGGPLQNGMSFIWQIPDGRFIIMDGGVSRVRDVKALYDFMYMYAPDKSNITVAAWIITHAHGDHHGAFASYCSGTYLGKIKVEQVIANFVSDAALTASASTITSNPSKLITLANQHTEKGYVKAHTGQIFYFGDASVDILYTYESILPLAMTAENTLSMVLAVEVGGQRFLMPGDATNDALYVTSKMYAKTLKSDYVQITHHGAGLGSNKQNGAVLFYSYSKAPVVLWPAGQNAYDAYRNVSRAITITKAKTTKEIFVAGSRNVILTLPYTVGTSGYDSIRK